MNKLFLIYYIDSDFSLFLSPVLKCLKILIFPDEYTYIEIFYNFFAQIIQDYDSLLIFKCL